MTDVDKDLIIAELRSENARLRAQLADYAAGWHKIENAQTQLSCAAVAFIQATDVIRAAGVEVSTILTESIKKIQSS